MICRKPVTRQEATVNCWQMLVAAAELGAATAPASR